MLDKIAIKTLENALHNLVRNPYMVLPDHETKDARIHVLKGFIELASHNNGRILIVENKSLADIFRLWLSTFTQSHYIVHIEGCQVLVAHLIASLTKLTHQYKQLLLDEGWISLLIDSWVHSSNKQIKLAALHSLQNLLIDESIAVQLVEKHGVDVLDEIAAIDDIDIHLATEKVLSLIKSATFGTPNITSDLLFSSTPTSGLASVIRLDDDFEEKI